MKHIAEQFSLGIPMTERELEIERAHLIQEYLGTLLDSGAKATKEQQEAAEAWADERVAKLALA